MKITGYGAVTKAEAADRLLKPIWMHGGMRRIRVTKAEAVDQLLKQQNIGFPVPWLPRCKG